MHEELIRFQQGIEQGFIEGFEIDNIVQLRFVLTVAPETPLTLWIDNVKHKTYVKVDEAGTEAAAVTVVVVIETSVPGTFTMRVDRPFLFAIREKHSGTVLFIGKIGNPGYLE